MLVFAAWFITVTASFAFAVFSTAPFAHVFDALMPKSKRFASFLCLAMLLTFWFSYVAIIVSMDAFPENPPATFHNF